MSFSAGEQLDDVAVQKLWQDYKKNNDLTTRNCLLEHYLPLVSSVVGKMSYNLPNHISRDDLLSSGFFGLMDALQRFDLSAGVKFESYAFSRIRGAVLDYLRSNDWLSVSLRKRIKAYEKAYTSLEASLGRTPAKSELAEALQISVRSLHELELNMSMAAMTPLEEYVGLEYLVVQADCEQPEKNLDKKFVQEKLAEAINKLSDKEKLIISMYYSEHLTFKEISLVMNLSEARISQLHKKAVFCLRGYLERVRADFF